MIDKSWGYLLKKLNYSGSVVEKLWASIKSKVVDISSKGKDLLVANTPAGEQTAVIVKPVEDAVKTEIITPVKITSDTPVVLSAGSLSPDNPALQMAKPFDGVLPNLAEAPLLNSLIGATTLLANFAWFFDTQDKMGGDDVPANPAASQTPLQSRVETSENEVQTAQAAISSELKVDEMAALEPQIAQCAPDGCEVITLDELLIDIPLTGLGVDIVNIDTQSSDGVLPMYYDTPVVMLSLEQPPLMLTI